MTVFKFNDKQILKILKRPLQRGLSLFDVTVMLTVTSNKPNTPAKGSFNVNPKV